MKKTTPKLIILSFLLMSAFNSNSQIIFTDQSPINFELNNDPVMNVFIPIKNESDSTIHFVWKLDSPELASISLEYSIWDLIFSHPFGLLTTCNTDKENYIMPNQEGNIRLLIQSDEEIPDSLLNINVEIKLYLLNPNNCEEIFDSITISNETTSNSSQLINSDEFSIFPNPVINEINFSNKNKFSYYEIYNTDLKKVKTGRIKTLKPIEVFEVQSGMYYLKLIGINRVVTEPFFKL